MELNIKPLSQKDRRWANKKLPGGSYVRDVGCLLVCLAMQLKISPLELLKKDIFRGNLVAVSYTHLTLPTKA